MTAEEEAIELPYLKSIEQFIEDAKFALQLDVEYLLVNGLEGAEGIHAVKKFLAATQSKIKVMVKVDNKWSATEIDSYIDVCLP